MDIKRMNVIKETISRNGEKSYKDGEKELDILDVINYSNNFSNPFVKNVLMGAINLLIHMNIDDYSYMLNYEILIENQEINVEEILEIFFNGMTREECLKKYSKDICSYIGDILQREGRLDIYLFECMFKDYNQCQINYDYVLNYVVKDIIESTYYLIVNKKHSLFDFIMTIALK